MTFNWETAENGDITVTPENPKPNFKKILTWGIVLVGIPTCIALGIKWNNTKKEKRLDEKLEEFSDIPGSPYYYHFQYFDTMQVVHKDNLIDFTSAGDGLIRLTCKDKNNQLWQLTQNNGSCWYGGPSFVNVGDDVIVGTDTSDYIRPEEYVIKGQGSDTVYGMRKHVIDDITAKQQAKNWLRNHKSDKILTDNQKLAFVTGTIKMVYDKKDISLFAKCIDEDGKVIIADALNPTNQDPITNVTTGQEVVIKQESGLKGTITAIVNEQHARDGRIRNLLHAHDKK